MVFEKQCDRTPLMMWRELFTRATLVAFISQRLYSLLRGALSLFRGVAV
jgi:hypothetical protein